MKVAVLGSHPATKRQAPFSDESWKVWACSPHNYEHGLLPRVDEWFEVHKPAYCPKTRRAAYMLYVKGLCSQIPVWMRDRSNHPDAREYPDAEMKRLFGPFHFTSSIAYILAKAIHDIVMARPTPPNAKTFEAKKGARSNGDALGLWGIMQASENEYAYQRPGIQHFLNEAHKCGIDVLVPEESNLLRPQEDKW